MPSTWSPQEAKAHRLRWEGSQGLGQALVHLLGSVLQVPATACH